MQIEPILNLFKNINPIPHQFRIVVKIHEDDNYEINSIGEITEDSETNTIHVYVNVKDFNDGGKEESIELGDLNITAGHKNVHVHLVDTTESNAGEGITSTESAQQESRPVTKDQLPD